VLAFACLFLDERQAGYVAFSCCWSRIDVRTLCDLSGSIDKDGQHEMPDFRTCRSSSVEPPANAIIERALPL
jgi:hypothetical protein